MNPGRHQPELHMERRVLGSGNTADHVRSEPGQSRLLGEHSHYPEEMALAKVPEHHSLPIMKNTGIQDMTPGTHESSVPLSLAPLVLPFPSVRTRYALKATIPGQPQRASTRVPPTLRPLSMCLSLHLPSKDVSERPSSRVCSTDLGATWLAHLLASRLAPQL